MRLAGRGENTGGKVKSKAGRETPEKREVHQILDAFLLPNRATEDPFVREVRRRREMMCRVYRSICSSEIKKDLRRR